MWKVNKRLPMMGARGFAMLWAKKLCIYIARPQNDVLTSFLFFKNKKWVSVALIFLNSFSCSFKWFELSVIFLDYFFYLNWWRKSILKSPNYGLLWNNLFSSLFCRRQAREPVFSAWLRPSWGLGQVQKVQRR